MSEQRGFLERARELEEKATRGPWRAAFGMVEDGPLSVVADCFEKQENSSFIAFARNCWPEILGLYEAAKSVHDPKHLAHERDWCALCQAYKQLDEKANAAE